MLKCVPLIFNTTFYKHQRFARGRDARLSSPSSGNVCTAGTVGSSSAARAARPKYVGVHEYSASSRRDGVCVQ